MKRKTTPIVRTTQCKACPWKKSTNPHQDIPGGYRAEKHRALASCQSKGLGGLTDPGIHVMACHESTGKKEYPCVGWLVNQLGPGNNIALRLAVMGGHFGDLRDLKVEGEQYDTMEEMLATAEGEQR